MSSWLERLHEMPLRTKVFLTVAGVAVAVVGVAGFFSFRYWEDQAITAAKEQALLAAESSRAAVESALSFGRTDQARRNLERLVRQESILRARVYGPDGQVVLSGSREGTRGDRRAVWIPDVREIPAEGLVQESEDEGSVRAFLSLSTPSATVFEVAFSVAPVERAMETGTRLSLALAAGSVLALGVILFTMLRQEVIAPMDRIQEMLAGSGAEVEAGGREGGRAEIQRVERSVARLIEMEERAERVAEERGRELDEKEGFAEVGQFASEMAHELKKPLSNIQTAVQLLEQEYHLDSEGGEELLEAVEGQLDRLRGTMEDLFSLARPVEMERNPTELPGILDAALAELRSLEECEGVEIRTRYDPETPPVLGDSRKLEQAVLNLMLNAVEAMEPGGVLTVRCAPSPRGGAEVVVEDTGGGIPSEEVSEVLRPFYSTKPMGTGLGLPLVARITRAHGGDLEFEITPGEGTAVHLSFPPPSAAAGPRERDAGTAGRREG